MTWSNGMIDADPLFADPANGDFHLTWNSPCRDTGYNAAIPLIFDEDYDGNSRIAFGRADMGADEYYPHLYHSAEVGPGKTVVFKAIGIPGAGSTLCHGPNLRNPPLQTPHGENPPELRGGAQVLLPLVQATTG